jgi:hypothetical protein
MWRGKLSVPDSSGILIAATTRQLRMKLAFAGIMRSSARRLYVGLFSRKSLCTDYYKTLCKLYLHESKPSCFDYSAYSIVFAQVNQILDSTD